MPRVQVDIVKRIAAEAGDIDCFEAGDHGTFDTIKALFAAVYELPAASLASVKSVQVVGSEFERPIFVPERRTGTWTKTIPGHERTDVVYESTNGTKPQWVDVVANLRVTVVLNADPGELDTITTRSIDDFTTLA